MKINKNIYFEPKTEQIFPCVLEDRFELKMEKIYLFVGGDRGQKHIFENAPWSFFVFNDFERDF